MLKSRCLVLLSALAVVGLQTALHAQTTPAPVFTQFIIFGDSLSDVGNDADVSDNKYGIRFPGPDAYNDTVDAGMADLAVDYTDGRFTDGGDTVNAAEKYLGVWHEQLADSFLGVPQAKASLDGGFDYAYGGAITDSGQSTLSEEDGLVSINVDNMDRQVSTFLDQSAAAGSPPDAAALYIVWGGANDLFNNDDTTNADDAAARESTLVQRLAEAGAKYFLVPNLPPLDLTPDYNSDTTNGPIIKAATVEFNTMLKGYLDNLPAALAGENVTGVTIYQLDVYNLFQRLLENQFAYGFDNITDSSQTADAGTDPDTYLFWDGVHPTTAGHSQLAAEAYTLLTGSPVIEVYATQDGSGFYFTRTGLDVSSKIKVHYGTAGSAVSGVDYYALSGTKKLPPGAQSVILKVSPTETTTAGRTVKVKVKPGDDYTRPEVKKAGIVLQ